MSQAATAEVGRRSVSQSPAPDGLPPAGAHRFPDHSAPQFPVLLTDTQAAACLGVSVRKFHDLRSESWMCRPVVLGPRLLRWPRAELEAAVASMPRQATPGDEPAQLLRGRIERAKKTGVPA